MSTENEHSWWITGSPTWRVGLRFGRLHVAIPYFVGRILEMVRSGRLPLLGLVCRVCSDNVSHKFFQWRVPGKYWFLVYTSVTVTFVGPDFGLLLCVVCHISVGVSFFCFCFVFWVGVLSFNFLFFFSIKSVYSSLISLSRPLYFFCCCCHNNVRVSYHNWGRYLGLVLLYKLYSLFLKFYNYNFYELL